ncbi:MAPEG family protein [Pseudomarimonas arenosa]|uniref:MAPEG family protein n=1 Tax=Pseudomarimonas arenosa TaxID=2774145 RepID=A0AAW3ZPN4_9GAMM|nr:MAPEG family protein [Pseudomarimonas arenosa]MBD8526582.1 MAPEG family protein [Pseudomarimonas arenosa]
MHTPPISALYIALGALLLLGLTFRVIAARRASKIGLGDGGDKRLLGAMRVHGNAVETLPIQLLLLVMLEWSGVAPIWIHLLGTAVLLSRGLHAWGLSRHPGVSFGRFWGTLISLGLMLVMPCWLIYLLLIG